MVQVSYRQCYLTCAFSLTCFKYNVMHSPHCQYIDKAATHLVIHMLISNHQSVSLQAQLVHHDQHLCQYSKDNQ